MSERRYTKRPLVTTSVRLDKRERDLMYLAALREGISQSDFLRASVRERAERIIQQETAR